MKGFWENASRTDKRTDKQTNKQTRAKFKVLTNYSTNQLVSWKIYPLIGIKHNLSYFHISRILCYKWSKSCQIFLIPALINDGVIAYLLTRKTRHRILGIFCMLSILHVLATKNVKILCKTWSQKHFILQRCIWQYKAVNRTTTLPTFIVSVYKCKTPCKTDTFYHLRDCQ